MKKDIDIKQGATFDLLLICTIVVPGDCQSRPIDMTGAEVRMQLRKSYNSDEVVLEASVDDGRICVGDDGSVTIKIPSDVTASMQPGVGVYDVFAKLPTEDVLCLLEGRWTVNPSVTKL